MSASEISAICLLYKPTSKTSIPAFIVILVFCKTESCDLKIHHRNSSLSFMVPLHRLLIVTSTNFISKAGARHSFS